MWRLKQLIPKDGQPHAAAGLSGRNFDVGVTRIHVQHLIADGGFSAVYLATDSADPEKCFALKHVVVRDEEILALVTREVAAMRGLWGHPNVVQLVGSVFADGGSLGGRGKEALLLMELCGKSLAAVLEERAAEKKWLEEDEALVIFRDACNAVLALHCQSPPVAHRDLKAENILIGADGSWKLCDFGSVSTNHKIFDKLEEMGIEEDTIRKHTTPAYRAPEMWDLYRREVISEKVDIWALGCLLYRICYLKLPFDGESKLQILNGNYRIPDSPKYSSSVRSLINDMLQMSPETRPDITQVWFRVNETLPLELQKDLPDGPPLKTSPDSISSTSSTQDEARKKVLLVPPRSAPPPPSKDDRRSDSPQDFHVSKTPQNVKRSMGAFWSSQYAQELTVEDEGPVFDREGPLQKNAVNESISNDNSPGDFEIRFSPNGSEYGLEKVRPETSSSQPTVKSFDAFEVDFTNSSTVSKSSSPKMSDHRYEEKLEAEVRRLKEELRVASYEKEMVRSKLEKLSAICSSQRQEIQDLTALVDRSHESNSKDEDTPPREKIDDTLRESPRFFSASVEAISWDSMAQSKPAEERNQRVAPKSVRTLRGASKVKKSSAASESSSNAATEPWGFESFRSSGTSNEVKMSENSERAKSSDVHQPVGWTGF